MKKKKFTNDIILKLRRQYSKDEAVKLMANKLSKTEIELGKLKSYVSELEDELEMLALFRQCKKSYDGRYRDRMEATIVKEIHQENKVYKNENRKLKIENSKLLEKLISLQNERNRPV